MRALFQLLSCDIKRELYINKKRKRFSLLYRDAANNVLSIRNFPYLFCILLSVDFLIVILPTVKMKTRYQNIQKCLVSVMCPIMKIRLISQTMLYTFKEELIRIAIHK